MNKKITLCALLLLGNLSMAHATGGVPPAGAGISVGRLFMYAMAAGAGITFGPWIFGAMAVASAGVVAGAAGKLK